jgi:hypothetical protein
VFIDDPFQHSAHPLILVLSYSYLLPIKPDEERRSKPLACGLYDPPNLDTTNLQPNCRHETFCTFQSELSSSGGRPVVLEELSGEGTADDQVRADHGPPAAA